MFFLANLANTVSTNLCLNILELWVRLPSTLSISLKKEKWI